MQLLDQFVSVMQTPDMGEVSNPVHGFRSERGHYQGNISLHLHLILMIMESTYT